MARNTMEGWLPEEFNSSLIQRIAKSSAVEAFARKIPMNSDTVNTPRSAGVGVDLVAKGAAYGEDVSANDLVTLFAQKFGKAIRIAEEDINDAAGFVNVVEAKKADWGTSYANFLDNATLGTTAAIGAGVPFTSVLRAVETADASVGYTAGANKVSVATGVPVSYDNLSALLALVEGGDYYDDSSTVIIAHPYFKSVLRTVKDGAGNLIFVQGGGNSPDTLFGLPVRWTVGAKSSATATATPTGDPLLIVANSNLLLLGVRSGPESVFIDGRDGASALTDESILKLRARRGFAVGNVNGVAVLRKTI